MVLTLQQWDISTWVLLSGKRVLLCTVSAEDRGTPRVLNTHRVQRDKVIDYINCMGRVVKHLESAFRPWIYAEFITFNILGILEHFGQSLSISAPNPWPMDHLFPPWDWIIPSHFGPFMTIYGTISRSSQIISNNIWPFPTSRTMTPELARH